MDKKKKWSECVYQLKAIQSIQVKINMHCICSNAKGKRR